MLFLLFQLISSKYEIKYLYNAKWLKIFFHNSSNQNFFLNQFEVLNCNSINKYSILNEINEKFKINNKFEFLLEYPNIIGYNRWVQNLNPINQTGSIVEGYEKIETSWEGPYWGGLAISSATTLCFIDGAVSKPDWWFVIGAYQSWGSTITFPGPRFNNPSDTYIAVSSTYLWIRIDGTNFDLQFQSKNQKKNLISLFLFTFNIFFI